MNTTETTHISPVGPQERRKAIVIGECFLDIKFDGSEPSGAAAGGDLLRAACLTARRGLRTTMVGEICRDKAGQLVIDRLQADGVDVRSVDIYTEGSSATHLVFDDPRQTIAYGTYPEEGMSVVWPRIDADDVVVYGGTYVLEPRVRQQVTDILRYARDRRAMVVYVPAFSPWLAHRITRHMPAVLENLESSDLTVALPSDLSLLFGSDNAAGAFDERVRFHADRMLSIGGPMLEMFGLQGLYASAPAGSAPVPEVLAALIETLAETAINHETIAMADNEAFSSFVGDVASRIRAGLKINVADRSA